MTLAGDAGIWGVYSTGVAVEQTKQNSRMSASAIDSFNPPKKV
jgi:hypothetical protein